MTEVYTPEPNRTALTVPVAGNARSHVCGWVSLIILASAQADYVAASTIRVPEDHATIQAAIDASSDGDNILVAPGVYQERLRLKPGIRLVSAGDDTKGSLGLERAESTVIDGGGQVGDAPGVVMAERSTLDGFTVTNVGEFDEALWNEHNATQGENQNHDHIGRAGVPGISIVGTNCNVTNNIVHHIGSTGIAIQGGKNQRCAPRILHNICYRNMGGGIGSMQKSEAIIHDNTCFQNFFAGIGHDNASPMVINNICFENIRAGIGISEGACPLVRDNRCYGNRRAGIGCRTGNATRPVIEHNECHENDMAGIGTEDRAAPIIRNNRCWKNRHAGIGSRTHAKSVIIGNECFENALAGIAQESNAVTKLIGNHCHDNEAAGIGFANCKSGLATVIDNRVINNAKVAIGIGAGWSVRLSGNELSREGGMPPLVMIFEGAEATFEGNTLRGGGVAALRVAGTVQAINNRIMGTEFRKGGPPNFAIWSLPRSTVTMTGNEITGWRHALHATGASVLANNNIIHEFHQSAFVIRDSTKPAEVFGNTAVSSDAQANVLTIMGPQGVVENNEIITPNKFENCSDK